MKSLLSILLLASPVLWSQSRSKSLTATDSADKVVLLKSLGDDECGNPLTESMLWTSIGGTAIRISSDCTVDLLLDNDEISKVRFAMISFPGNASFELLDSLNQMVLERRVEVWANPSQLDSHQVTGRIFVGSQEINLVLLEKGWASYQAPDSSEYSWYVPCTYRKAEFRAKKNRRGIWH